MAAAARTYPGKLLLSSGKKVIELRPNLCWNKGDAAAKAVELFGRDKRPLVIYAGDDATDEDAFRALARRAVTIRVGRKGNTRAKYYLRSTKEMMAMLKELLVLRERGVAGKRPGSGRRGVGR